MYSSVALVLPTIFLGMVCQVQDVQSDTLSLSQQRWEQWRKAQDVFPIATWSYFNRYEDGAAGYQSYKDANMTWVQAPVKDFEAAKSVGLKVLLGSWEGLRSDREKLKNRVEFPTPDDRTVVAYMLKDEPHPDLFEPLGSAFEYIYKEDRRDAVPIVDLFPNWAVQYKRFGMSYETYVDKFTEVVKPPLLLNCHYPPLEDGTDRPEYYPNMEHFRKKALDSGIGLMGFVLIYAHRGYRVPSESDLRWQVYSHIAYGAKGIWYYNHQGLVTLNTWEPTKIYDSVKAVNGELLAIGQTLLQLRSKGVFHTGPEIPLETSVYAENSIPILKSFVGTDFLLGEFENMDDDNNDVYLMLVNKRHSGDAASADLKEEAAFAVDLAYPHAYQYDRVSGGLEALDGANGSYKLEIGGGQGILLRFSQNDLTE